MDGWVGICFRRVLWTREYIYTYPDYVTLRARIYTHTRIYSYTFLSQLTLPRNCTSESSSTRGMPLYPTLSTISGFPAHETCTSRRTYMRGHVLDGVGYLDG